MPEKEDVYSHLNMREVTDADCSKALLLLLADVFENLRNTCLEIHELDPALFLTAPGLAWQGALKKTKVNLDLLNDIDMLLMVEKSMRG